MTALGTSVGRVLRRALRLAKHAIVFEVAIYVAIWRWVSRRPAVPAGAQPIPYAQLAAPMMWLFIWGSAVEVVALDLVVAHFDWDSVRIPLLIVGVWSVVWMVGLLAAMRTRPHVLTTTELRLRSGLLSEFDVPLAAIARVRTVEHELTSSMRSLQEIDGRLLVGVSGRTNIELELHQPTPLDTPKGVITTDRVAVWVDEPRVVATQLRAAVQAPTPA